MSGCPMIGDTKLDHLVKKFTISLNLEFLVVVNGRVSQSLLSDTIGNNGLLLILHF